MTATSVADLLSGGGAPSAKFPTIGTTIKGTVEDATVSQQTDFQSGVPLTWDDGSPRMQIVVTLQTDDRDPSIDDDDGKRRVFVKGQMLQAVKEAVRSAGVKTIEPGGTLAIQYKEDGEQKKAGHNPPKIYVAQYKAGTSAVSVEDLI